MPKTFQYGGFFKKMIKKPTLLLSLKSIYEKQTILYYFSLFLIVLPPISLLFGGFSLHTLAKFIWLFLFINILYRALFKKENIQNNTLLILFSLFFVSQSVSVLSAREPLAFLSAYEDLVFTALFVFLSVNLVKKSGDLYIVTAILLFGAIFSVFVQLFILFLPQVFLSLGNFFLHKGYLDLIALNLERKRVYLETYDEALIPIILYFLFYEPKGLAGFFKRNRRLKRVLLSSIFFLISVLSFASNFRTRFLMFLFGLGSSLLIFGSGFKKHWPIVFSLFVLFIFLFRILSQTVGFTVVDRFLLESKREDVMTVTGRIERWKKAFEIGVSAPLIGVGLGNYYDYLDPSMKKTFSLFKQVNKEFEFAALHPHNIFFRLFAETGMFGLGTFLILLSYFVVQDIKIIKGKDQLSKAFVLSFWTLFVYAIFNPSFTTRFQATFWLLRVLISRSYKHDLSISMTARPRLSVSGEVQSSSGAG